MDFSFLSQGITPVQLPDPVQSQMRQFTLATVVAMAAITGTVMAQSYPVRPIRMLVPFAPGGSADFVARLVGQKLGESFGQQVVVGED